MSSDLEVRYCSISFSFFLVVPSCSILSLEHVLTWSNLFQFVPMLKLKRSFVVLGLLLHPFIDWFDGVICLGGLGLWLGLAVSIVTMIKLLVRFRQVSTAIDRFQQNPTGAINVLFNVFSESQGLRRPLIIVITLLSDVNPWCFCLEGRCLLL